MGNVRKSHGRARTFRFLAALTGILTVSALALAAPTPALGIGQILGAPVGLDDFDARTGKVPPSSQQLATVSNLGAHATWNRFGTPQSLIKYGGCLATGLSGSAVDAARSWIRATPAMFRRTD